MLTVITCRERITLQDIVAFYSIYAYLTFVNAQKLHSVGSQLSTVWIEDRQVRYGGRNAVCRALKQSRRTKLTILRQTDHDEHNLQCSVWRCDRMTGPDRRDDRRTASYCPDSGPVPWCRVTCMASRINFYSEIPISLIRIADINNSNWWPKLQKSVFPIVVITNCLSLFISAIQSVDINILN